MPDVVTSITVLIVVMMLVFSLLDRARVSPRERFGVGVVIVALIVWVDVRTYREVAERDREWRTAMASPEYHEVLAERDREVVRIMTAVHNQTLEDVRSSLCR